MRGCDPQNPNQIHELDIRFDRFLQNSTVPVPAFEVGAGAFVPEAQRTAVDSNPERGRMDTEGSIRDSPLYSAVASAEQRVTAGSADGSRRVMKLRMQQEKSPWKVGRKIALEVAAARSKGCVDMVRWHATVRWGTKVRPGLQGRNASETVAVEGTHTADNRIHKAA